MLTPDTVAGLTEGITQYATSSRGPLSAPELQIISEYRPANGPRSFDFNLIHESVWRCWPGADALTERVDVHTFLGLLHNLPDIAPWTQPEPHFTVIGFSLRYDAPAEPGPAPSADYAVRDEPARVTVAVDAGHRFYHHVHQAGAAAGQVAVWAPVTIGPLDTPNRVTHGDRSALNELSRLMDRLRTPTDPPADTAAQHKDKDEDEDVLVHGEIVTVTGDRFDDDDRARLWVVVDHFFDYAIAVLGGDGYYRRNIPRGDLARAEPQWIQRTVRHDATFAYVDADTTTPTLVDETFTDHGTSGYELVRTHRLAGSLLRVRVWRGPQPEHSSAVVQLLDPAGDHSVMALMGQASWHAATPSEATNGAPLYAVAEELLHSAVRILTPADPAGPQQP
ncbi:hypothetical protein AB0M46_43790 [Dactylosporangium sp. NPDC051485]|uniref:hypothetical protein n=1 Tax=Dactylosporangium sp. NPDC051485 TaxID=3154846 RepID=UPI003443CA58